MRTRKEELEFCYGNALEEEEDLLSRSHGILRDPEDPKNGTKKTSAAKKVKFDWIPENVSDRLARKYLNQIPESAVPIAGSEAAQFRQQVSIPIEILLRTYYRKSKNENKIAEFYVVYNFRDSKNSFLSMM